MKQKKVLIIDGHSWMHRAFHAMQAPLTSPDGQPTNAVFGFFSMLSKTLGLLRPDALVVAFDEGKATARIEALAQYKIQRPPTDPNLKAQFPIIKELLEAMRVPVACVPHIEGDDILGTLSLQGEQAGLQIFLATSDRDAYQLITDNTKVISQGRGSDGPCIIGPAEVEERFGVTPGQIVDFLGLKGDSSDNIPGVPGVGEKTAAKLLTEFGTLEEVLKAAAEGKISGKAGKNLVEYKEAAEVSRFVATIQCDVPLDIDLVSLTFGDYTTDDIKDAFMHYGLRSALGWMVKFSKNAGEFSTSDEKVQGKKDYSSAGFESGAGDVSAASFDSDAESSSLESTVALESPYKGVTVDSSGDTLFDNEQILAVVGASPDKGSPVILQAPSIVDDLAQFFQTEEKLAALDLKALYALLAGSDKKTSDAVDMRKLCSEGDFDLSVAAYLLASNKNDFSLKELAQEYAGADLDASANQNEDDSLAADRVTERAQTIARLAGILEACLEKDDSLELYRTIELPLIPVLARMEHLGICVGTDKLEELAQYGRVRIENLRAEVFELAGTSDFNPDSPKQLAEILFDHLGLPVIKKTRTSRSTNAAVLTELKAHHPIAEKIIEYREAAKLQSTYLEALPKLIASDGRIHTSFNQTVTTTGRLSSSNPNMQNIPIRTELGRRIREAFVPKEGWKLMSVDYSQIELRILAELSQDPGLIDAFNSGEDFHKETAIRIFGLDAEAAKHIDSSLRSKAKAVNFGIIYGQGPHGLGQALDISYGEAKHIIDRYYATFPRVKDYLDQVVNQAKKQGWVATYYGRKRHIPELYSSNRALRAFGERTAMNHPMQGTAADIIKLAMIAIDSRLRESGLQAQMLLQVHDELVFEAPPQECDQLSSLVTEAMTKVAPDFTVPLEVNITTGSSWA
ncbi:MAG: DNA polymerase I [Coriobacteriia bacterium]|nr:DNA polymerase I [Coriobacteriia bacterium]